MVPQLRVSRHSFPEGEGISPFERLCDLFDSCGAAATRAGGIPGFGIDGAPPQSTQEDRLRVQLFRDFSAVLDRHGVADPAGLDGVGLAELMVIAAPYLLGEQAFARHLQDVGPDLARQQAERRRTWVRATAPAPPRIEAGESAASAMTRLHSGLCNRDAYAQGLRDLGRGHKSARTFFFLVPYAVGRHRGAAAPPYAALTVPETFAVEKAMRALVAGLDLPDTIARLPLTIQYRAHNLTERLYDFQFAVLQLLSDDDLPDVLPSGPPLAEAEVTGLGVCEAALHLITAAIDVATEGCSEIGRNAAPRTRPDAARRSA